VSDRTAEISTSAKTVGADLGAASSRVARLLEFARDRSGSAAAHGWNGVAENMELGAESIEGVVQQLTTAEVELRTAAGVLDEITDKMSSPEVAAHLGTASGELGAAHGAVGASVALVDEAVGHCEAAGQQSLPASLNTLRDDLVEVVDRLSALRNEVDAEQQEAEGFAGHDDNDGAPGN
jgi:flagellar hook-basal body complex protein FliE